MRIAIANDLAIAVEALRRLIVSVPGGDGDVGPAIYLQQPDGQLLYVLEKLWKAGYVFHAEGSLEADFWVMERTLRILLGVSPEGERQ